MCSHAGVADHLREANGQILGRAQDTNVATPKDRAEGGLLGLGYELTHQDGAHLRCLPAPVDVGHDAIHRDFYPQLRHVVARPQHARHSQGLLPLALGLPPLEVLGGAVDEALGPTRAEGHARAPLKEVVGHAMGQRSDHGRVECTHVVSEVAYLRDTQVAVIRPQGSPTRATLEGAHGDVYLTTPGLRTDHPGVAGSRAGIQTTRRDVRILELLGLQRNLGLENLTGHLASLCEDRQRGRGYAVKV